MIVRNEINKNVKYNSFIVIGVPSRQAKNGTKKQTVERKTVLLLNRTKTLAVIYTTQLTTFKKVRLEQDLNP